MRHHPRKTTPRVKSGRVQKKNRWERSPTSYSRSGPYPAFSHEPAGSGYKHLIRRSDLYDFVDLVPQWDELSVGLRAVVLTRGDPGTMGRHWRGVVEICAWEKPIAWDDAYYEFIEEHEGILSKLDVPFRRNPNGLYTIEFDERTARAFQLVHVFVHELGHHHDRMTTRTQWDASRGEPYAEEYAARYEDEILDAYWRRFDRR